MTQSQMLSIALIAAGLIEQAEPFQKAAREADKIENRHAEKA